MGQVPSTTPPAASPAAPLDVLKAEDITIVSAAAERFPRNGNEQEAWLGPREFKIRNDPWILERYICAGGMGQTYLATDKSSTRQILKCLMYHDDAEASLLESASRALFDHPNIVKVLRLAKSVEETSWNSTKQMIFMDFVPNGDFFDLIHSSGRPLCEGTCRRFVRDLVDGLAFLRDNNITHRDLKPENLLLDGNGRVVIIDFGHAKRAKNSRRAQTGGVGTPDYRAPEAVQTMYDSELADVWTVGVILFMMMSQRQPFQGGEAAGIGELSLRYVHGRDNSAFWEEWWRLYDAFLARYKLPASPDFKVFLQLLWRKPDARPRLRQLKLRTMPELRWLAGELSPPLYFVRELRERRPHLMLLCEGTGEAFQRFLLEQDEARRRKRRLGRRTAESAFQAANASGDGLLKVDELTSVLCSIDARCTQVSTAELMSRYTSMTAMNQAEFHAMQMEWLSCLAPTASVRRDGVLWKRWTYSLVSIFEGDSSGLVRDIASSMAGVSSCEAQQPQLANSEFMRRRRGWSQSRVHCYTRHADSGVSTVLSTWMASMATARTQGNTTEETEREVCQIRLDLWNEGAKIIVDSRCTFGSELDEIPMLTVIHRAIAKTWRNEVTADFRINASVQQTRPRKRQRRAWLSGGL
eukprot:TRINITY_DN57705_c0_g2_i1.p1 TRINITY_DN57705_c0_g2~~TRINITY_DN57705_c0_g2_i1.p1  ORF type:complete len:696 (-),score=65.80 TRINITY_DN57705_c0_g2_i1:229-2148(-)